MPPLSSAGISYYGLFADNDFTAPVAGAARIGAGERVLTTRSRVWPPRQNMSVTYHLVPFDSSGAQMRSRAVSATVPYVRNVDGYGPRAGTAAPQMGEVAAYRTGAGVTVIWGDVRPGSAATESGTYGDVNDYTFGRLEVKFASGSSTWTRRIGLTGSQAAVIIDSVQGRVWYDGYLGGSHDEPYSATLARDAQVSVQIRVQGRAEGGAWLFSPWTNPITIPATTTTTTTAPPATTTTTTTAAPARPSVPAAPSGLRAAGAAGRVTLSWDDPGDGSITGYQLRERPSFDGNWWCWSGFSASGTGTITRRVTKLPAGATYRIQLRALNAAGPGPAAEVSAATTAAASPGSAPAAPGGLSGTGADESITLSWNNPGDSTILQYQFRERPDNEASWRCWRRIYHSTAATTGHTMPGITNNTRYRVQLRALNAAGPGPAAETSATPTAGTAPPGP